MSAKKLPDISALLAEHASLTASVIKLNGALSLLFEVREELPLPHPPAVTAAVRDLTKLRNDLASKKVGVTRQIEAAITDARRDGAE